jgi:hypothetical protein
MGIMVEREKIAQRAYQIYEKRGKTPGSDFDDWLQAEKELAAKEKTSSQISRKKAYQY